jgi:hypothetical protein
LGSRPPGRAHEHPGNPQLRVATPLLPSAKGSLQSAGQYAINNGTGGQTILSIQIVAQARRSGLNLTVRQVFQHRTIAALAADLKTATSVAARAEQGPVTGPVTLTPILHWFTRQPLRHNHFNQSLVVECAHPVDAEVLRKALQSVISHHDSLGTSLKREGNSWTATIEGATPGDVLEVVDLSTVAPEQREARCLEAGATMQAGLSIKDSRLVRAALFTGDGPDRVQLVIHHIAVDTISWGILAEDLDTRI